MTNIKIHENVPVTNIFLINTNLKINMEFFLANNIPKYWRPSNLTSLLAQLKKLYNQLNYWSHSHIHMSTAFVSVPTYERLLSSGAKSSDLLPVAAVFKHPKNKEHVKGYYSDIIIHVDQTLAHRKSH